MTLTWINVFLRLLKGAAGIKFNIDCWVHSIPPFRVISEWQLICSDPYRACLLDTRESWALLVKLSFLLSVHFSPLFLPSLHFWVPAVPFCSLLWAPVLISTVISLLSRVLWAPVLIFHVFSQRCPPFCLSDPLLLAFPFSLILTLPCPIGGFASGFVLASVGCLLFNADSNRKSDQLHESQLHRNKIGLFFHSFKPKFEFRPP